MKEEHVMNLKYATAMYMLQALAENSLKVLALCPNGNNWDVIEVCGNPYEDDGTTPRVGVLSRNECPLGAVFEAGRNL